MGKFRLPNGYPQDRLEWTVWGILMVGVVIYGYVNSDKEYTGNADIFDVWVEDTYAFNIKFLNVVAREPVSITDIVLNEGNCGFFKKPGGKPSPTFPISMGMGDEKIIWIVCPNLIEAELQTTRGTISYTFSSY